MHQEMALTYRILKRFNHSFSIDLSFQLITITEYWALYACIWHFHNQFCIFFLRCLSNLSFFYPFHGFIDRTRLSMTFSSDNRCCCCCWKSSGIERKKKHSSETYHQLIDNKIVLQLIVNKMLFLIVNIYDRQRFW